jgi:hypothetical protein
VGANVYQDVISPLIDLIAANNVAPKIIRKLALLS